MDDLITIPRESLETFLSVANNVLGMTEPTAPDNLERAEVVFTNNKRKQLAEAVYQAEKAIYDVDTKPLTVEQMSINAEKRRSIEDGFSDDKASFIEGRR